MEIPQSYTQLSTSSISGFLFSASHFHNTFDNYFHELFCGTLWSFHIDGTLNMMHMHIKCITKNVCRHPSWKSSITQISTDFFRPSLIIQIINNNKLVQIFIQITIQIINNTIIIIFLRTDISFIGWTIEKKYFILKLPQEVFWLCKQGTD